MSTLHCNSTSFGYMKPSTPGIIIRSYSAHRAIQVLVINLGSRGHVRFQDLDFVGAQDFVDGVLRASQIHQQTGAGGAVFAAGRGEALGDAVVAQGTLVHGLRLRVQIAAAIRAGLHTVAAAQAVGLVHQHYSVRADERGAHRTDLHARRLRAVVTQLGNEEALDVGARQRRKAIHRAVGRFHVRLLHFLDLVFDLVALHPGPEVPLRHVVLLGTGTHTVAAADALVDVDDHAPPVVGHAVGIAGRLCAGDLLEGGAHRRENQQLPPYREYVAPADVHTRLLVSEVGIVGLVAGVAGHATRVFGGRHLRKILRFRRVFLMAAAA